MVTQSNDRQKGVSVRKKPRTYEGKEITITYDLARCIHAEECAHGLPQVFDPKRRPWVDPDAASANAIADVIHKCPTGALGYRRADGVDEVTDLPATIAVDPDGPLYLRGAIRITMPDGQTIDDTRVALCRCGASKNKPYCDDSHVDAGFAHDGLIVDNKLGVTEQTGDGIDVSFATNGPILVSGEMTMIAADGNTCTGSKGALCRCGESSNKPFCDGTHKTVGFEAA